MLITGSPSASEKFSRQAFYVASYKPDTQEQEHNDAIATFLPRHKLQNNPADAVTNQILCVLSTKISPIYGPKAGSTLRAGYT